MTYSAAPCPFCDNRIPYFNDPIKGNVFVQHNISSGVIWLCPRSGEVIP